MQRRNPRQTKDVRDGLHSTNITRDLIPRPRSYIGTSFLYSGETFAECLRVWIGTGSPCSVGHECHAKDVRRLDVAVG
jgi:hypothetical protein